MAFLQVLAVAEHNWSDRLRELRAQWAQARSRNRVYRQTYEELMNLSDRELADLGISRSHIASIAREASEMATV